MRALFSALLALALPRRGVVFICERPRLPLLPELLHVGQNDAVFEARGVRLLRPPSSLLRLGLSFSAGALAGARSQPPVAVQLAERLRSGAR